MSVAAERAQVEQFFKDSALSDRPVVCVINTVLNAVTTTSHSKVVLVNGWFNYVIAHSSGGELSFLWKSFSFVHLWICLDA